MSGFLFTSADFRSILELEDGFLVGAWFAGLSPSSRAIEGTARRVLNFDGLSNSISVSSTV